MYELFSYFMLTWLVCAWVSSEVHYDRCSFIEKIGEGVFMGLVYNCSLWIALSIVRGYFNA